MNSGNVIKAKPGQPVSGELDELDGLRRSGTKSQVLAGMARLLKNLDSSLARAWLVDALNTFKRQRRCTLIIAVYRHLTESYFSVGESHLVPGTLIEALVWCRRGCRSRDVNAVIRFIEEAADLFPGAADSLLPVIVEVTKTLLHFEKPKEAINHLIQTAMYFSRNGAYQTAYRILGEAEVIARKHQFKVQLVKVVFTLAVVASDESDHSFAAKHFTTAIRLSEEFKIPVHPAYGLNFATMLMRLGKPEDAEPIFEKMLSDKPEAGFEFVLRINLAACRRSTKGLHASEKEILEAQKLFNSVEDLEHRTEFHLVAAKTYLESKNEMEASRHVLEAISGIGSISAQSARLHLRRGVRSTYAGRLRHMAGQCIELQIRRASLACLAFIATSMNVDWCRYLDWCDDSLKDVQVPQNLKTKLRRTLEEIKRFGAPVLLGFREKYDDPFQVVPAPLDYTKAWTEFEQVLSEVAAQRNELRPHQEATDVKFYFEKKLSAGAMLLFSLVTEDGCKIVAFFRETLFHATIEKETVLDCHQINNQYVTGQVNRSEFVSLLTKTSQMLSITLKEIIKAIPINGITEVFFIPDALSIDLPLLVPLIEDCAIREKMLAGKLAITCCPIAYPSSEKPIFHNDHVLSIWDSTAELPLAREEPGTIKNLLIPKVYDEQDLNQDTDFNISNATGIIHYAGHGFPMSLHQEPFIAHIGSERKSISIEALQINCPIGNYSTVFLNACHSGVTANRNYYQYFKTTENLGFASIFLLNRKSIVIAPAWATPDVAAYVFSVFFYQKLSKGCDAAVACSHALARFYNATKDDAVTALEQISNRELREEKIAMIKRDARDYPFREIYCYGAYRAHSLL